MIARIPSSQIHTGNSDFDGVVSRYGFEPQTFSNINKTRFFERMSNELEEETYDEFIEKLFEECGHRGDKFNIQTFILPFERNYLSVVEKSQRAEDSDLSNSMSFINRTLYLSEVEEKMVDLDDIDWSTEVVDLSFKTRETIENIEPTEDMPIRIVRADNGDLVQEYSEEYLIEAPTQDRIEARVYISSKMVSVSNGGGISQGVQTDIVDAVAEWGEISE